MRVAVIPSVTSIEDAIALGLHPDSADIRKLALPRDDSPRSVSQMRHLYSKPPRRYSEMMKVSMTTIMEIGLHDSALVREAINAQVGQLEYAVAALCIWLTTDTGKYVCNELPLHTVPLDKWDVVKTFSSEARRLGQVFGRGKEELNHAFRLRKLQALMGRTDEDADWVEEVGDRVSDTTSKRAYDGEKISFAGYTKHRDFWLKKIAEEAVRGIVRRCGDFEEFFNERWWSSPRGTTSHAAEIKKRLKSTRHMDFQMRPIKPTAMECLSHSDVVKAVASEPVCVARGSTKPEPGLKKRALLAVDDTTAFISGYASQHIETATKLGGMVLRQDPTDISEWLGFDAGSRVWRVSNDFSNFNMLHSLRSLQAVDLALAAAWDKVPYAFAKSKAAACRWVAKSYLNAYIRTPIGNYKVHAGLWSGHRNTARDNTMLHLAYLEAIKTTMAALFGEQFAGKQRLCGDDETVSYYDWVPAAFHAFVADELGFTSQASKGLLSRNHDEFLQLMRFPGNLPEYPVAHTILTFCSGNWYKDPVRDLSTTIKDVSDHVWDMVLGGVPVEVGQKLAGATLNYLMQCKQGDTLVPLEWWAYRGCVKGGHPLWGVETPNPPTVNVAKPTVRAPKAATNDSITREQVVWDRLNIPDFKREVERDRAWQSYRNVAKNWLQARYDEECLRVWPRRCNEWETTTVTKAVVPNNRWRCGGSRAIERSPRGVAVRNKLPPEILGTAHMSEALLCMPARDRAILTTSLADKQAPTIGWRWNVPPLLRAV